jgi:lysophospholipid acyltransferase (LPLAT)-like uncharacterized protein
MAWEAPELHPTKTSENCIYCTWHENILMWAYIGAFQGVIALVSRSRDGETTSRAIEALGFRAVRGSSRGGAVRAVKELIRSGVTTHVAITPDGPLGPRHVFQLGAVYLASRTGAKLVPTSFAFDRAWRARSWDRFVVPKPFSRVVCFGGSPIMVPPNASADELVRCQHEAGKALKRCTAGAEWLLAQKPSFLRLVHRPPGRHVPIAIPEHSRP